MPSRLFSAGGRTASEGLWHWTLPAGLAFGPSWLLPQQAAPRPLSVGCADHAKNPKPPGKRLLSEKKLVRLLNPRLPSAILTVVPKGHVWRHGSKDTGPGCGLCILPGLPPPLRGDC